MKKRYWVLIILGAILLPFVLNWLILQPRWFGVVGDGTHWLSFWITYISVIATLLMVYYTKQSLNQNQRQLEELKRQWEEQNRARLSFSVIPSQNWYSFKISNIGKANAFNIKIKFSDQFLDALEPGYRDFYTKLMKSTFSLEEGTNKYLPLGRIEGALKYWKEKCEVVSISGSYCNEYEIRENMYLTEYMHIGMVHNDVFTTEFQYFKKGVIVQNNDYMPIQKSLDMIAKKIEKIKFEDKDTK